MAESYRYLSGGGNLYSPPLPDLGVPVDSEGVAPVGLEFGEELPVRYPALPDEPLPYKHENMAITKPGEQSLQDHKVAVWDENTYKHIGVPSHSLQFGAAHPTTAHRQSFHSDEAIIEHHSGQRVRYTTDPATGLFVYRGFVYDQHVKDPPLWGSKNYEKAVDRSDYWTSPLPVTSLAESNPTNRPRKYNIEKAHLHKPLPDNFTSSHAHFLTDGENGQERPGYGKTDRTLRFNK